MASETVLWSEEVRETTADSERTWSPTPESEAGTQSCQIALGRPEPAVPLPLVCTLESENIIQ